MLYIIVADQYAYIIDTVVYENYREIGIGLDGKPGKSG